MSSFRVCADGSLSLTPSRGSLMGNRGVLCDQAGTLFRKWACRRWIYCSIECEWRARSSTPRKYTKLFFKDEVSALAAGHRPCGRCLRGRSQELLISLTGSQFLNPGSHNLIEVDKILHRQRLAAKPAVKENELDELPDGVIISYASTFWFKCEGTFNRWSWDEMDSIVELEDFTIITPTIIVSAFRNGFSVSSSE